MTGPCRGWEDRLVELLYEDADAPERAETRAHLAECPACRTELEQLTGARDLLAAWPNAVNVPRVVYLSEPPAPSNRVARRAARADAWRSRALLAPVAAAAVLIVAALAVATVLDLEVASDGTVRIGRLSADPGVATGEEPITRAELRQGLDDVVDYLDATIAARSDQERRLLLAALDERLQEQGLSMSRDLRGAVEKVLDDAQREHEGDLRLVFSAIDEMGLMTSAELQRMNAILGSLALPGPGY